MALHPVRIAFSRLPVSWRIRLRRCVELHYHGAGYGDTLLVAAVAREIKRTYGSAVWVTINGAREELLRGNPRVDAAGARYRGIDMNYHRGRHNAGPRLERNLLAAMCRRVGIRNPENRVEIFLDSDELSYARTIAAKHRRRPLVTLQASSGAFGGGRKLWPAEHWAQLVRLLRRRGASVLQLGATDEKRIAGAVPLLGEQDIRRSIAIVGEADIHVGTVSSLMHGSAAVGTPAVIIYGGFERSSAHGYPSVHPIESSISCAPCARAGVRMPACPLGNECMRAITPQHVFHEVMSVLHRGTAASPAGQR